jgi:hypothetical protein
VLTPVGTDTGLSLQWHYGADLLGCVSYRLFTIDGDSLRSDNVGWGACSLSRADRTYVNPSSDSLIRDGHLSVSIRFAIRSEEISDAEGS